jgi:hypothetical protein
MTVGNLRFPSLVSNLFVDPSMLSDNDLFNAIAIKDDVVLPRPEDLVHIMGDTEEKIAADKAKYR